MPQPDRPVNLWSLVCLWWVKIVDTCRNLCVSAGTQAITDAGCVSRIEVGKSTQADIAALLGYPITASYGGQGEETWHYTWITAYPTPFAFVPVVKAVAPSLGETARALAVTFSREGTVKSLGVKQPRRNFSPSG